jgi:hypothetical protein
MRYGGLAKQSKAMTPLEDSESKDDWEPLKRYGINRVPARETNDKNVITPEAARDYQAFPYENFRRGGRKG